MEYKRINELAQNFYENPSQHVFFLGAGNSVAAGIPTANGIISELKEKLYRNRKKIGYDVTVNADAINKWFSREYPLDPLSSNYSQILQIAFPSTFERRQYFESLIDGRLPTLAHKFLAKLIIRSIDTLGSGSFILTTNFDRLMEQALIQEYGDFPYVSYHEQDATYLPESVIHPTLVKLHGDFLYEDIANLDDELSARIKGSMSEKLTKCLNKRDLAVIGYSGNDITIMNHLMELSSKNQIGNIYWILRKKDKLSERASNLLRRHTKNCSSIVWVENAVTFFENLYNVVSQLLTITRNDLLSKKATTKNTILPKYLNRLSMEKTFKTQIYSGVDKDNLLGVSELAHKIIESPKELYIIIGPTGSGKTTFLKKLCYELIKTFNLQPEVFDVGGRSPGWSSWARVIPNSWEAPISLAKHLIFDGLEQNNSSMTFITNLILWKKSNPQIATILAIRADLPLPELNLTQTYWMREIDPTELQGYSYNILGSRSKVLLKLLSGHKTFEHLCSRPLYFQMLIRLAQHYKMETQLTKGELFDRFCTGYLMDWQVISSGAEHSELRPLINILSHLAYSEIDSGEPVSIDEDTGSLGFVQLDKSVISKILNSGLIIKKSNRIQFLHAAFRDYFGARYLYEQVGINTVVQKDLIDDPKWYNSLSLLPALMKDSSSLIMALLAKNTSYRTSLAIQALLESRQPTNEQLIEILNKLIDRFKEDIQAQAHHLTLRIGVDSFSYIMQLLKSPLIDKEQKEIIIERLSNTMANMEPKSYRLYLRAISLQQY